MLHLLFNFHSSSLYIKQVHFLLLHFTPFSSIPLQSSASPTKPTRNNASSDNFRGIAKHVISKCSHGFHLFKKQESRLGFNAAAKILCLRLKRLNFFGGFLSGPVSRLRVLNIFLNLTRSWPKIESTFSFDSTTVVKCQAAVSVLMLAAVVPISLTGVVLLEYGQETGREELNMN
ncbi:uncharacterized protein LOC115995867 [Ipomoea triloba]|uniref:uncharacterized protein LOC115995867 n=1 Tax=Ipomoea triloba TaxID=35885 RepID=UPI00125DBD78|nr:uncharacterized protein LOC115995867 [Ipomoea triloba]